MLNISPLADVILSPRITPVCPYQILAAMLQDASSKKYTPISFHSLTFPCRSVGFNSLIFRKSLLASVRCCTGIHVVQCTSFIVAYRTPKIQLRRYPTSKPHYRSIQRFTFCVLLRGDLLIVLLYSLPRDLTILYLFEILSHRLCHITTRL